MFVEFVTPQWLWLLVPLLAGTVWLARRGAFASRLSRNIATGLRCLTLACLVLSLAGAGISREIKNVSTIFAVDLSDSAAGSRDEVTGLLKQTALESSPNHTMGLVAFGQNAQVEANPTAHLSLGGFSSLVDATGSNLEAALVKSGSLLQEDGKKRVILFSDGRQTAGDTVSAAGLLAAAGITVDVFPLAPEAGPELQMSSLSLPKQVGQAVEYAIEAQVESTTDTTATIRLYKDNRWLGEQEVTLRAGTNRFRFLDKTEEGGQVVYRAEVAGTADTRPENNQAYAYTTITDLPRILILEQEDSGRQLAALLEGAGLSVTRVAAGEAPTAMERLAGYDGVALANVAYDALPAGFVTALEAYVRLTGGGLLVTGGENAYALGGYYGTDLEEILPLDMNLRTQEEDADLGMIFVIDRSGSMMESEYGLSKMEMAKEAVIRSLDSLEDKDSVGVLTFDTEFAWNVPLQKVGGNQAAIGDSVAKIQSGGGTSILPALSEAYRAIQNADCRIKHIVLLTDGQAERSGYDTLLRNMAAENITLSTIAVGQGADVSLLGDLAERAGGRFYFTNAFTDLPEIFAREALLAGQEYLNNRRFYPAVTADSPLLTGIAALPALNGYVGTVAKPRADVVLESDKEEPVLADWRYGLGRAVCWTSDANGQWTAEFLASAEGQQLFRNMISYLLRNQSEGDVTVTAEASGGQGLLTVQMPYDETVEQVTATVLSSRGESYEVALSATAPGTYTGAIPTDRQGVYITTLSRWRGQEQEVLQTAFSLPYPAEYDLTTREGGRETLERIAAAGGGQILSSAEELLQAGEKPVYAHRDISRLLLGIALILFLLDILFRRAPGLLAPLERRLTVPALDKAAPKAKAGAEKRERAATAQKPATSRSEARGTAEKTKKEAKDTLREKEGTASRPGTGRGAETAGKASTAQSLLDSKRRRNR